MRVTIDQDDCTACGVCMEDCPEVFEEDDEGISQIVETYRADANPAAGEIPDDLENCAQMAAEDCPVEVIHVGS